MLKSKYIFPILLLISVALTSCLKEDEKVTPHQPGSSITANVNMGTNYKYQYYYDLETNTVVGQHLKDIWDIGYDSNADGHAIVLNGANFAKIWRTGQTDFAAVTDTTGAKWRADDNTGRLDSTAIGEWG
ncbi:MAG: HmuY family protein [Sphingobacteriales bacterium JAD_PAG50586_3]|nr:MAG: HmuY family protein [Sphingobacteriales bacterium JAD_PAG50586_3]